MIRAVAIILGVAGLAVASLNPAKADRAADESAIKELFARRDAAWNAHDAAAWSAFFAPDGHFTNWQGAQVQGREKIQAFHAPLFAGIFRQSTNTTLQSHITFCGPDLAIAENDTQMTGALDPADPPGAVRNYHPLVVLKKDNGKWEIIIFHNVREQMKSASAAR